MLEILVTPRPDTKIPQFSLPWPAVSRSAAQEVARHASHQATGSPQTQPMNRAKVYNPAMNIRYHQPQPYNRTEYGNQPTSRAWEPYNYPLFQALTSDQLWSGVTPIDRG